MSGLQTTVRFCWLPHKVPLLQIPAPDHMVHLVVLYLFFFNLEKFWVWGLVGLFAFYLFRAAPAAYGSSWARGRSGAAAVVLRHNHMGAKLHLRPTPQLTGNARSLSPWARPGIEPIILQTLCLVLNLLSRNRNFQSSFKSFFHGLRLFLRGHTQSMQ